MDREKKGKIYIWVLGSLLGVPLVGGYFILILKWLLNSRDTSEIIWKILIVVMTILLSYRLISAIRRFEDTRIRKFEKKIESELGLKPIRQKALVAKYIDRINKRRFYAPIDEGYGKHIFHGEYNGYEICLFPVLPACPPPIQYWMGALFMESAAVYIKSSSFHFPKFLIANNLRGKFSVKGFQRAQMLFARPHILDFFNKTRRLAAQGNGDGFMFFEVDIKPGNYRLLIENAFTVLKLLSNVETPSRFTEIELMKEKNKRIYRRKLIEVVLILIGFLVIGWLIDPPF